MFLLLSLGRLTWSNVSHSGLLRFVQKRLNYEFEQFKNVFLGYKYPEEVIVDTINKTIYKFRNNIRSFGPPKCPVYVRLPWIGSLSQLTADKVSSSVTRYYNAVMVWTIFTTPAAFHSTYKDMLPIFQQSWLIYEFQCCCNATYIKHTSRLEVRVKQHIPRDIRNCTTSRHSKLLDSAICEHLNISNSYAVNYNDECFCVLHRARTKQHLVVLEALYILLYRLTLCKQNP